MTYFSLLLRIVLIVAISLNGYAAAAMTVGGAHATHRAPAAAVVSGNAASSEMAMTAECHEGMAAGTDRVGVAPAGMNHAAMNHGAEAATAQPADASLSAQPDDCCGTFRCQCDCTHAVAIVRVALRLAPALAGPALALPPEAAAPNGVSSLPIRPPIA
ncbi:MAG: CopL family metal-binding regulatory protein [Lysobacter sp.]|nr:CopL family metal-binding regulatory protein [Lysobacter sp.]